MDAMQQNPAATATVPRLNHLCNTCSQYFPSHMPWPWLVESISLDDGVLLGQSSILQLIESTAIECHFCTLLLEALRPERTLIGMEQLTAGRFQIWMLPDIGGFILKIKLDTEKLEGDKNLHCQPVFPSVDDYANQKSWTVFQPFTGTPTRIDVVQTRSSSNINPLAIQQIKQWLSACTEKHDACSSSDRTSSFPRDSTFRLLDIGLHTDDNVRLIDVDSSVAALRLEYITLSYRWTDEIKRTNLTVGVEDEFYKSIQTDAWPRIYRDAVLVARQLGIRYLWIDSLCIVQDRIDDWETQAALMDKIYGRGFLNLAGVGGEGSVGLEVTRNPLRVAPCLVTFARLGLEPESSPSQNYVCYRPDDIMKAVDRTPLYGRGWTFQERVLSRRTVHFGDQLFWECTCLRASEAFPLGVDHPDHPEPHDVAIQTIRQTLQKPTASTSNDRRACNDFHIPDIFPLSPCSPAAAGLHRQWCTVVRCYSSTELTNASDRLVALRGITNRLAHRYGLGEADYADGLWKPWLPLQLIWARESTLENEQDTLLSEKFPSWSWASCDGESRFVEPYTGFVRPFIRLDSAQGSKDNAGTTEPAYLVLRGRLIPTRLIFSRLTIENNDERRIRSKALISHIIFRARFLVRIELDRPVPDLRSEFYLLPVIQRFGPRLTPSICGLVLRRKGMKRGMEALCRLGIFHSDVAHLEEFLFISDSIIGLSPGLEACLNTVPPIVLL